MIIQDITQFNPSSVKSDEASNRDSTLDSYSPHLTEVSEAEKEESGYDPPEEALREDVQKEEEMPGKWGAVLDCLWKGQLGDAELLIKSTARVFDDSGKAEKTIAYDRMLKELFYFDSHWHLDDRSIIRKMIFIKLPRIYRETADFMRQNRSKLWRFLEKKGKEGKKKKEEKLNGIIEALQDRASTLQTELRVRQVLTFVKDLTMITGTEWDSDPNLLGIKNGVIEFPEGNFRPAKPSDYIKTVAPTPYHPEKYISGERIPLFRKLMEDVYPNEEVRAYMMRVFGSALTGHARDHVCNILYGPSSGNGKGTQLNHLKHVLGDLACPASDDLFKSGSKGQAGQHQEYMAALKGKRLIWFDEIEDDDDIKTKVFKRINGGSIISTRGIYGKQIEIKPTFTSLVLTNFYPKISAYDEGAWRRIRVVEVTTQFVDDPDPNDPTQKKLDREFEEKLNADAEGTLYELVEGEKEWHRIGLNPPKEVVEASQKYRNEVDYYGKFVDEFITKHPNLSVKGSTLQGIAKIYAEVIGIKYKKEDVARAMKTRGFSTGQTNGRNYYREAQLNRDALSDLEDEYRRVTGKDINLCGS